MDAVVLMVCAAGQFVLMIWFASQAIEVAGHDAQMHRLCAAMMCFTGAAGTELLARAVA